MGRTAPGSDQGHNTSTSEPPGQQQLASVPPLASPMLDHSFTLQAIMDLKGSQSGITEAIKNLTEAIIRQDKQLDKIENLRVDVARIDTRTSTIETELGSVKNKLDLVYKWVIGAGAIIAFIVIAATLAATLYRLLLSDPASSISATNPAATTMAPPPPSAN